MRDLISDSGAPENVKRLERDKLNALVSICETDKCRRAAVLACLGEEYKPPCNNCDNCLHPPEQWDGTTAAQKFLSCVVRTREYFGAGHIADVLRGTGKRAQSLGHHKLSTFGIGREMNKSEWSSLARQLVAAGKLAISDNGVLSLTKESWEILRGKQQVFLRKDQPREEEAEKTYSNAAQIKDSPRREKVGRKKETKSTISDLDAAQMEIFEILRAERRRLANAQNVKPYNVFHDTTLLAMARNPPQNEEAFAALPGVGAAKVESYCRHFLRVLQNAAKADATGADNKAPPDGV